MIGVVVATLFLGDAEREGDGDGNRVFVSRVLPRLGSQGRLGHRRNRCSLATASTRSSRRALRVVASRPSCEVCG
jgi:hypothetical protein